MDRRGWWAIEPIAVLERSCRLVEHSHSGLRHVQRADVQEAFGAAAATEPAAEVSTETDAGGDRANGKRHPQRARTIGRLRAELGEMANAIAQIRSAVDAARQRATDIDTLLQSLEDRTRRMSVLVGPPAAWLTPALPCNATGTSGRRAGLPRCDERGRSRRDRGGAADRPDRVPTVSRRGVAAWRCQRRGHRPRAKAKLTSVAMLEAMVEQLAAAMPAAPHA